ncbi:gamma-glutamylcyclotransferase family protein [Novosphingobium sp.]|uniref:gamma-glutamylcyclotransferase family protein n=1 Tax=Novosphingobium sp. TaxID=1874826 RepID=UPI002B4823CC|nr:gamma-glutamylcyclotransferase family protein [Novosphingobium sp.]HKR92769.1 gamma-glutamylcyclotransferase family protein [Novosphingobium sp.]
MRRLRLFVYGTLQPQAGTPMARWIAARTLRAQPASAAGRLFALRAKEGWYPALIPAHRGLAVSGMLCELVLAPGELARLDLYEGQEYRRISQPVRTCDGRGMNAQLYSWRVALPPSRILIADGHFLDWMRAARGEPYGSRLGIGCVRRGLAFARLSH